MLITAVTLESKVHPPDVKLHRRSHFGIMMMLKVQGVAVSLVVDSMPDTESMPKTFDEDVLINLFLPVTNASKSTEIT